jgi:hypothetical protein
MCNYYRNFIEGYSSLARPLTDLTKKSVPTVIPWNEEALASFEVLKQKLCSAPVMTIAEVSKKFILHVDASGYAVGACLSQIDDTGEEHPIAYASQKLNSSQCKWSTIEKEAYAVIWALKRFDSLLFRAKIEIVSDHNPLAYIVESSSKSARLTRWSLALQRYYCSLSHRAGSKHANADMLSRLG